MRTLLIPLVLCTGIASWAGDAAAQKKPAPKTAAVAPAQAEAINIEADSMRYDDVRQVSVFKGRVVLTRGGVVISGEQIEVRQDPEGYQYGAVTGQAGQLALFRQQRPGQDEYVEAEAEVIEYDGREDVFRFRHQARLRRFHGGTQVDEIHGSVIQYNNLTDVFTVDGGEVPKPGAGTVRGRVRAVLAPRKETSAPSQPAAETGPAR